jgi:hypothetical protein
VGKTRRHELKLGLLRKVVQAARGSVSRVPAKWTNMPGAAVKIGGARGRPALGSRRSRTPPRLSALLLR